MRGSKLALRTRTCCIPEIVVERRASNAGSTSSSRFLSGLDEAAAAVEIESAPVSARDDDLQCKSALRDRVSLGVLEEPPSYPSASCSGLTKS